MYLSGGLFEAMRLAYSVWMRGDSSEYSLAPAACHNTRACNATTEVG